MSAISLLLVLYVATTYPTWEHGTHWINYVVLYVLEYKLSIYVFKIKTILHYNAHVTAMNTHADYPIESIDYVYERC